MADLGAMWIRAMRAGRYPAAWAISRRVLRARDPAGRDDPALPYHRRWLWDGRPLAGRDVLVRCYQGLGDTIMFARFLPLLARHARSVTVEAPPALLPLLRQLPGVTRLIAFDPARPTAWSDADVEICELAFALRAAPEDAPPPYLSAPPADLPPGTIGLCHMAGEWDRGRHVPLPPLIPLCRSYACITLVAAPTTLPVGNPEGCPLDMTATAAAVAGSALVITVDTMIAHLAGALGRPVWLLLKADPDWRWVPHAGISAWYPTMRTFTQRAAGDWTGVLAAVEEALARGDAAGVEKRLSVTAPLPPPSIPVSWGELLDKLTILRIKRVRIADARARANVEREQALLARAAAPVLAEPAIAELMAALHAVNAALWEVEDGLREHEAAADFGAEFVALARAVYRHNDERAALKRRINADLRSELVEEKCYGGAAVAGATVP